MIRDLDQFQQQVIANAAENELWQLLSQLISEDEERLIQDMRDSPKLCDDDLTQDIRHQLGGVDRLKWVLGLPGEAQDLIYPQRQR